VTKPSRQMQMQTIVAAWMVARMRGLGDVRIWGGLMGFDRIYFFFASNNLSNCCS
jgi:hypothetical protein